MAFPQGLDPVGFYVSLESAALGSNTVRMPDFSPATVGIPLGGDFGSPDRGTTFVTINVDQAQNGGFPGAAVPTPVAAPSVALLPDRQEPVAVGSENIGFNADIPAVQGQANEPGSQPPNITALGQMQPSQGLTDPQRTLHIPGAGTPAFPVPTGPPEPQPPPPSTSSQRTIKTVTTTIRNIPAQTRPGGVSTVQNLGPGVQTTLATSPLTSAVGDVVVTESSFTTVTSVVNVKTKTITRSRTGTAAPTKTKTPGAASAIPPLSGRIKTAIILGSIFGLLFLLGLLFCCLRLFRRRKMRKQKKKIKVIGPPGKGKEKIVYPQEAYLYDPPGLIPVNESKPEMSGYSEPGTSDSGEGPSRLQYPSRARTTELARPTLPSFAFPTEDQTSPDRRSQVFSPNPVTHPLYVPSSAHSYQGSGDDGDDDWGLTMSGAGAGPDGDRNRPYPPLSNINTSKLALAQPRSYFSFSPDTPAPKRGQRSQLSMFPISLPVPGLGLLRGKGDKTSMTGTKGMVSPPERVFSQTESVSSVGPSAQSAIMSSASSGVAERPSDESQVSTRSKFAASPGPMRPLDSRNTIDSTRVVSKISSRSGLRNAFSGVAAALGVFGARSAVKNGHAESIRSGDNSSTMTVTIEPPDDRLSFPGLPDVSSVAPQLETTDGDAAAPAAFRVSWPENIQPKPETGKEFGSSPHRSGDGRASTSPTPSGQGVDTVLDRDSPLADDGTLSSVAPGFRPVSGETEYSSGTPDIGTSEFSRDDTFSPDTSSLPRRWNSPHRPGPSSGRPGTSTLEPITSAPNSASYASPFFSSSSRYTRFPGSTISRGSGQRSTPDSGQGGTDTDVRTGVATPKASLSKIEYSENPDDVNDTIESRERFSFETGDDNAVDPGQRSTVVTRKTKSPAGRPPRAGRHTAPGPIPMPSPSFSASPGKPMQQPSTAEQPTHGPTLFTPSPSVPLMSSDTDTAEPATAPNQPSFRLPFLSYPFTGVGARPADIPGMTPDPSTDVVMPVGTASSFGPGADEEAVPGQGRSGAPASRSVGLPKSYSSFPSVPPADRAGRPGPASFSGLPSHPRLATQPSSISPPPSEPPPPIRTRPSGRTGYSTSSLSSIIASPPGSIASRRRSGAFRPGSRYRASRAFLGLNSGPRPAGSGAGARERPGSGSSIGDSPDPRTSSFGRTPSGGAGFRSSVASPSGSRPTSRWPRRFGPRPGTNRTSRFRPKTSSSSSLSSFRARDSLRDRDSANNDFSFVSTPSLPANPADFRSRGSSPATGAATGTTGTKQGLGETASSSQNQTPRAGTPQFGNGSPRPGDAELRVMGRKDSPIAEQVRQAFAGGQGRGM